MYSYAGGIAGCPGQYEYCFVPNPNTKPNPRPNGSFGHFGPILGPVCLEIDLFLGLGDRNGLNATIVDTSQTTAVSVHAVHSEKGVTTRAYNG